MSIKSFFVPKTALQGEEIPIHVIWDELDHHGIRIDISSHLQIKEIYNVAKKSMRREDQCVLIEKTEVGGYLGMVIESKQLEKARQDAWLSLTFLDKKGEMIEKRQAKILLFRPKVVIEEIPDAIKVSIERGFVHSRIKLRNVGDATAIIRFRTRKESELKRKLPKNIEGWRKEFYIDAKENLSRVQDQFPSYSVIVDKYLELLKKPLKEKKHLEKMEEVLTQLKEGLETNEDFGWAFVEALGAAFLKNVHLITIFENFLQYLSSVAANKILIYDPLEVVSVSPEMREIAMNVSSMDLAGGKYPEISLPKIKIISNKQGEVPIYRLFEWKR